MPENADTTRRELIKYLDPQVLARIHRLDVRTRLIVEGFMTGLHRSPYQGLSVEFAQHREYVPGDDTRHIDWKVFSRTDRYYIKQYEEETNLRCTFLVDCSESMKYAGATARREGLTKYQYAASVAASISLMQLQQQDAPGLVTFDNDVLDVVPPSASPNQIKSIVHLLEQASARLKEKTSIEAVCNTMAETLSRRGMVCLISDLLVDNDDALIESLNRLAHRGHDVLVLHILDEDELTFPFDGNTRFIGLEDAGEMIGQPRSLREGYLESLNAFLSTVKRACTRNRMSYATISTADSLGGALGTFLSKRVEVGRKGASKHR